jgi:hypothetical protein
MRKIILSAVIVLAGLSLNAQKYSTKNGFVGFYSHTAFEDIKADNNQVASILDASTGDIVFQLLNKAFHFEKALMEEHFNENYMESETFPKATFKGKIDNIKDVDLSKPGKYKVNVSGEMSMHGVTKSFSTPGTLEVTADGLVAVSDFRIKPEDYGITIPGVVREKISENMTVSVNIKYLPVK